MTLCSLSFEWLKVSHRRGWNIWIMMHFKMWLCSLSFECLNLWMTLDFKMWQCSLSFEWLKSLSQGPLCCIHPCQESLHGLWWRWRRNRVNPFKSTFNLRTICMGFSIWLPPNTLLLQKPYCSTCSSFSSSRLKTDDALTSPTHILTLNIFCDHSQPPNTLPPFCHQRNFWPAIESKVVLLSFQN